MKPTFGVRATPTDSEDKNAAGVMLTGAAEKRLDMPHLNSASEKASRWNLNDDNPGVLLDSVVSVAQCHNCMVEYVGTSLCCDKTSH